MNHMKELIIYGPYNCPFCSATAKFLINAVQDKVDVMIEAVDNQPGLISKIQSSGFKYFPVIAFEDKFYNGIGQKNLDSIVKLVKSSKDT